MNVISFCSMFTTNTISVLRAELINHRKPTPTRTISGRSLQVIMMNVSIFCILYDKRNTPQLPTPWNQTIPSKNIIANFTAAAQLIYQSFPGIKFTQILFKQIPIRIDIKPKTRTSIMMSVVSSQNCIGNTRNLAPSPSPVSRKTSPSIMTKLAKFYESFVPSIMQSSEPIIIEDRMPND